MLPRRVIHKNECKLDHKFDDAAHKGKDSMIESLFLQCVNGVGGRSGNEIIVELEIKQKQLKQVNDDEDEDDEANDAKRKQLRSDIKILKEELAKCSDKGSREPFPFASQKGLPDFSKKIGVEVLASLEQSYESLSNAQMTPQTVSKNARDNLEKILKISSENVTQLHIQLHRIFAPPENCLSQQTATAAGILTPFAPSTVLPYLMDPNVPQTAKSVITAFTISIICYF